MVLLDHFDVKSCKFGEGAIYLNNSYVAYQVKDEYKLDKDFTIDYWVRESEQNSDTWNIHLSSSVNGGIMTGINNGKFCVRIYGVKNLIEVEKPKNNEWTHIAVCRKNNIIYVYFNGKLQGSVESDYTFLAGILSIGCDYYNGYYAKNTYIDELRILNGVAQWDNDFTPYIKAYD